METLPITEVDQHLAAEVRRQLVAVSTELHRYRALERSASRELRELVARAAFEGVSENEISKVTGITRVTVRHWLGK